MKKKARIWSVMVHRKSASHIEIITIRLGILTRWGFLPRQIGIGYSGLRLDLRQEGSMLARQSIAQQLQDLTSLVCPSECLWCEEPLVDADARRFCAGCRSAFVSEYNHCDRCAAPLPSVVRQEDCPRCKKTRWKFDQVIALGPYRKQRRQATILIKKRSYEQLRVGLGELLGELLLQRLTVAESTEHKPLVIPVPNHWTHTFAGTADTAAALARAASRTAQWEYRHGVVKRVRKTGKQGTLSWAERRDNVKRAFTVVEPAQITGRHVVLVDDVLTTGATTNEMAKCLKDAGASRVVIAVIARGTGARASGEA